MTKVRSVTIDMARGVTILLVASFHANASAIFNETLADVRMPLFFLLTGFLFSQRYIEDGKLLLKKRIYSLVIPYFSAAIIFYLFWLLRSMIGDESSLLRPLLGMLYGNSVNDWLVFNIALWFLVCLFCAQIVFCVVMRLLRNRNGYIQFACFITISLLGVVLGKAIYLPWSLDVALACQLFLFVGYTVKKHALLDKFKPISFITLLLAVIFAITAYFNPPINVGFRTYNNVFLFYTAGISGSIVMLKLISLLSSITIIEKVLSYVGRESLIILVFHGGLFLYATGVIQERLGIPIHWILAWLISIIGSLVVAEIIKRIPLLNYLLNGNPMPNKKVVKRSGSSENRAAI